MIDSHTVTRRGWSAIVIDADRREHTVVAETVGELCRRIRALSPLPLTLRREPLYEIAAQGEVDANYVASKLGISTSAASARLARATRAGWMRRIDNGLYEVNR